MSPLKLDLNNLTAAHLAAAEPNCHALGAICEYAAPCIIGTLIPEDQRLRLDNHNDELGDNFGEQPQIGSLIDAGLVEFPEGQRADAEQMQTAFDSGNWEQVVELAKPYIK